MAISALDHGAGLPTSFSRHVLGSFSSLARDAADFIHGAANGLRYRGRTLSASLGSLTLSPLSQPGCIKRPTNDLAKRPFPMRIAVCPTGGRRSVPSIAEVRIVIVRPRGLLRTRGLAAGSMR